MDWKSFEKYVKEIMEEENIAGVAIGVSKHGKTIYKKGFGVSNKQTKDPVDSGTIFGIASITKSFTALAIMQLQQEGKLSVDDPVIKYLPEFKLCGVEDMSGIKIHHLLSHTTGCPPMKRRQELNKLKEHLKYLANEQCKILGRPGDYLSYCNDTFLLLGAIIERVTGKLYRRHITEAILDPLKMYRSTFSLEEVEKYENVSVPYNYNSKEKQLEKQSWPVLGNYEVGGGIRSCIDDLLNYGEVYVQDSVIIDRKSISKMYQPVYKIDKDSFYGYALKSTINYNGVTLVEHGGGQPGVSSNFGFIPEEEAVIAVLTNVGGVSAGKIWMAVVNTMLGLPLEYNQRKEPYPYYNLTPRELEVLTGKYKSAEGQGLTITIKEGKPIAKIGEKIYELRASTKDTLVLKQKERPIKFYLDKEGKPWAVLLGMRMLHKENK
ncbi:serine hydrolase domain-containing protein [Proteinivorax tanatarense]|uniref:Serine hydrolase domain-containing protein n=1 Tax=Proteinivorax tanatarense TaxID=1260629 RepID=A0AAU7VL23_9FIRM